MPSPHRLLKLESHFGPATNVLQPMQSDRLGSVSVLYRQFDFLAEAYYGIDEISMLR